MNKISGILLSLGLLLCACSSDNAGNEVPEIPNPPVSPKQLPIVIDASVNGLSDTRATDYGFEAGDRIGLYVVNRTDGAAGKLQATGNHVDNMAFTYNGTWTPATPIYWTDDKTHADFYLYYPYTASISNVEAMPFNVAADQSAESAYKASDLMRGTAQDVAPTDQAVSIATKHLMSQIAINLAAGNGFTEESLAAAAISVKINGVKTQATVNLATAAVTATGTATTVTPLYKDGSYKALIVPQEVAEGNLITVTADGRDFNLRKAFTFEGGKRHKFTVTLSKTSNGINVGIDPWEDDGNDNGGTAE